MPPPEGIPRFEKGFMKLALRKEVGEVKKAIARKNGGEGQ